MRSSHARQSHAGNGQHELFHPHLRLRIHARDPNRTWPPGSARSTTSERAVGAPSGRGHRWQVIRLPKVHLSFPHRTPDDHYGVTCSRYAGVVSAEADDMPVDV
jgi:hypothetical protein